MGQPHPSGRAALRMLEHEGFVFDRYIDIFDGGPTVTAATDHIRTIRESHAETVGRDWRPGGTSKVCSRPAGWAIPRRLRDDQAHGEERPVRR